jgi:hypothetical protein
MAKQRSIIKLDGTISDITFYKTADATWRKKNQPFLPTALPPTLPLKGQGRTVLNSAMQVQQPSCSANPSVHCLTRAGTAGWPAASPGK